MSTQVNLSTVGGPWKRVAATNVAAADAVFVTGGLAAKAYGSPFAAAANLFLLDLKADAAPGGQSPSAVIFRPFGGNDSNDSFSMRVWGIEVGDSLVGSTRVKSWEVTLLAELLVTLGSRVGVASTLIEAADLEADTVAMTDGASQDVVICSPEGDLKNAWARIDTLGFSLLAVEFDDAVNSGTAADDCNSLYRWLW